MEATNSRKAVNEWIEANPKSDKQLQVDLCRFVNELQDDSGHSLQKMEALLCVVEAYTKDLRLEIENRKNVLDYSKKKKK
jgi:hypothetical protein